MTENEQVTCQNSALIDFYRFLQIPNRLSPLQRPLLVKQPANLFPLRLGHQSQHLRQLDSFCVATFFGQ